MCLKVDLDYKSRNRMLFPKLKTAYSGNKESNAIFVCIFIWRKALNVSWQKGWKIGSKWYKISKGVPISPYGIIYTVKLPTAERIIDVVQPSGMPNAAHIARNKEKQMGILSSILYSKDPK